MANSRAKEELESANEELTTVNEEMANGHETHTAHDGVEAMEAAARLQPDAILLDIGLPRLNGYEVARRIREQQGDARPVLVALTGWGQDEDRRRSEDAGFDAHMVKPVDDVALGRLLVALVTGD